MNEYIKNHKWALNAKYMLYIAKKIREFVLFLLMCQHYQVIATCCILVTTVKTLRPILHAGNILINFEDDCATLDDDSSTLIRNEAIELHDEWRGRSCVST